MRAGEVNGAWAKEEVDADPAGHGQGHEKLGDAGEVTEAVGESEAVEQDHKRNGDAANGTDDWLVRKGRD